MLRSRVTLQDILDTVNHTPVDSPGLLRAILLFLTLVTAQVKTPEEIGDIVIKNVNAVPVRVRDIGTVSRRQARLHSRHRQWKARGSSWHQSPAGQQHRRGSE